MTVALWKENASSRAAVPSPGSVAPPAAPPARAERLVHPSGAFSFERATYYVGLSHLEQKLGRVAVLLLEAWWTLRDWDSYCSFAALTTVAAKAGITRAQALRAEARLRAAGLVVLVEKESGTETRRCHRYIRGKLAPSGQIAIPRVTWLWLQDAPDARSWGGARRGAGRAYQGKDDIVAQAKRQNNLVVEHEDGSATFGTGTARAADVSRRAHLAQELLPVPGIELIGNPVTPWPPKIKKDDPDVFRARLLANAYQGAIKMLLKGVKCFVFRRGGITRSKHYALLLEAAKVLEEKKLAPAAWVAWSVLLWKGHCEKEGKKLWAPPVSWVFSPKRIEQRHGWCSSESGDYLGNKCLHGPLYKHFVERRAHAVSLIQRGGSDFALADARRLADPDNADALERLVAATIKTRVFPEGYERAIDRVRAESARTLDGLKERARDGEWIWSVL